MTNLDLPAEIEVVFREFRTCELSTIARDGTPITWPTDVLFQRNMERFLITTSIGLPQKALNIRRNPRVSLLFSDPTGSGVADPPAVLVQGDAKAPDKIITSPAELDGLFNIVFQWQPALASFSNNPLMRYLFDWGYMRLRIHVTPYRILWWDHGDFTVAPHKIGISGVKHVE